MNEVVALINEARARGVEISADQYPYIASSTGLTVRLPEWALDGGTPKLLERLRAPAERQKIRDAMTNNSNWADPQNWTTAVVAFTPNAGDKQYEGKNLQEISELRKQDPVETTLDLLLENNGMVNMVYFGMNEDDVKEAMRQPWVSVGSDGSALQPEGVLGEGKPHPRNYGTFTRVLQKYVHDEKVITLEDAVRKMTSLAADQLHLRDRGLLRVGMYADVVVFDPNKVVERATFTQPHQFSEGMQYVVVNGKLVIDGGQHTGAHPGQILYGPGKRMSSAGSATVR